MSEAYDFSKVEFINEQERQYLQEALLGEDFRAFLVSDIGRLLHGRAKQQYEEAKERAIACNTQSWLGRRKFRKAQDDARLAEMFMRWCAEVIAHGDDAVQVLESIREGY